MTAAPPAFFAITRHDHVATITVADSAAREELRSQGGSIHWEFAKKS